MLGSLKGWAVLELVRYHLSFKYREPRRKWTFFGTIRILAHTSRQSGHRFALCFPTSAASYMCFFLQHLPDSQTYVVFPGQLIVQYEASQHFDPRDAPEYAILSHTWEDEEILFEDVRDGLHTIPRDKKAFAKVAGGQCPLCNGQEF